MIFNIICVVTLLLLLVLYSRQIKTLGVKKLVLVAVLCAFAAAGGAAMTALPGIQPTSFIIILCGSLCGGGAGVLCGLVSALLFDVLSTFSIYTLARMLLWGLMGAAAALLPKKPVILAVYGLLWGFVFGWILNSVYIFYGLVPFTWAGFIASCVSSFYFDLSHGLCNAVLLLFLSGSLKKLYGKYYES